MRDAAANLFGWQAKSIRCVELLKRTLDSHPNYRGVLCFSAREAAFLAGHGLDDLVVAYPSPDPVGLAQVADLSAKGHNITLMVDSEAQLPLLQQAAQTCGARLQVCLDLDMSQD